MVDIEDVAREAGVSTATVSRAIRGIGPVADATRERVLHVARELGYVPSSSASSLASGRTRAIGVIVPYLDRWYYGAVLHGIELELRARDYGVLLFNLAGSASARVRVFDRFVLRKRADALLAVSLRLSRSELAALQTLRTPLATVGGRLPGLTGVHIDDAAAARLATEHLLELGHRDIVHLGDETGRPLDFHSAAARRDGFAAALAASGVPVDGTVIPGEFSFAGGLDAATHALARPRRPTGIVAASDELAIGAIMAALAAGLRVPQDLSVIGIDGHPEAERFGLTTVDQHPQSLGRVAAARLVDALEAGDGTPGDDVVLRADLVLRTSTAPPA